MMVLLDVTEEVLLRLTVKDLLRCKSVCKSWCSIISSPSFVNLHLKHIRNKEYKDNKQLGTRRIAMTKRDAKWTGYIYYLPEKWVPYLLLGIQGSSNGLVCLASNTNRLAITNPSTREFRKLHKPPNLPSDDLRRRCYGFGYDSYTDDYKLVCMIDQGSHGSFVQILSLKSNVWKIFGHVNYRFHFSWHGILFNGALHWIMHYDINRDKCFIVSFDLATEEFKEIELDDTRYCPRSYCKLGIFKDRLCIFKVGYDDHPYDIWVMKNYNVKQSSVVCWELLPTECEMKDRVHYMIRDSFYSRKIPTYFCCPDTVLSSSGEHIWSPIFVQTLVSPYVNNHTRPSDSKKNKRTVEVGSSKERREIEEVYTLKDGEKNAFHLDEDVGTRRKRKRKSIKSLKKTVLRKKQKLCMLTNEDAVNEGEGEKKRTMIKKSQC